MGDETREYVLNESSQLRLMSSPGQKCEENPKDDKKYSNLQRPVLTTFVMSLSFLFAFTAQSSIQNLQSSLHDTADLGITGLAVLYGAIVVFGSLSPTFIRFLGAKCMLVASWVSFAIYTIANFYPVYATLLTSSFLTGIVSGPMWTSQGLYISASGMAYAESNKINVHEALSKFNGIFFAFYEASQITGNLISSLVFSRGAYNDSLLKDPDRICGADVCPGQGGNATQIEQPEESIVYILLAIFLVCNVVGIVLTAVALPTLPHGTEAINGQSSLRESLTSCLSMLLVPRMLLLLPFFMAQAMNSGLLMAEYTQKFVSCAAGIQWVGYVMTAFGVLTAALAIGLNFATRFIGRQLLFPVAALVDMSVGVSMLLWNPVGAGIGAFFILPSVSGFAEGIFQAQFNSLVAMVFPDHLAGAFATYHTSKAAAFTMTFVLARFLCLRERLYFTLAFSALGLLGYAVVEGMLFCQRRRESTTLLSTDIDDIARRSADDKREYNGFSHELLNSTQSSNL